MERTKEHDLLTVQEVADYLRVSGKHIRDLAQEPGAPVIRVGQAYRIEWPEFLEWLNTRKRPA